MHGACPGPLWMTMVVLHTKNLPTVNIVSSINIKTFPTVILHCLTISAITSQLALIYLCVEWQGSSILTPRLLELSNNEGLTAQVWGHLGTQKSTEYNSISSQITRKCSLYIRMLWGRAWASWCRGTMSLMSDVTHQINHFPISTSIPFTGGYFAMSNVYEETCYAYIHNHNA